MKLNLILLPHLLPAIRKVSGSSLVSKTMAQRSQNVLVYSIRVSQCSVVTRLRRGGTFNDSFIANFPQIAPVKEFGKSVENWQSYVNGYELAVLLFWNTVHTSGMVNSSPLNIPLLMTWWIDTISRIMDFIYPVLYCTFLEIIFCSFFCNLVVMLLLK